MSGRLEGRIALITGASRGIGAAVAEAYAREGAHLILVARTVGGLEETDDRVKAAGGSATLVPLDLTDYPAIDRLGASIFERWKKLDVLVANHGSLGVLTPIAMYEPKMWDEVMAVNLSSCHRLIRSLDPLLRQSDAGRAIFLTSGAAVGERPNWGAYAVSKAGLEAMVRSYAGETRKTKLRVNLLNPGGTRTKMRATAFPGEDPMTLKTPEDIAPVFVDLADPACTRHGERIDAQG
jgi:NAD(P)-dependent dehydrogenase (short-subunit alcohol dehydrogenase family)